MAFFVFLSLTPMEENRIFSLILSKGGWMRHLISRKCMFHEQRVDFSSLFISFISLQNNSYITILYSVPDNFSVCSLQETKSVVLLLMFLLIWRNKSSLHYFCWLSILVAYHLVYLLIFVKLLLDFNLWEFSGLKLVSGQVFPQREFAFVANEGILSVRDYDISPMRSVQ